MLHACLYTICFVFCYTSWHFYAFSRTNLLRRCHSASSLFFCYFCVSEKLHRKYSRNWMKQKPKSLFFPDARRRPKESRRGARGLPHHMVAWVTPRARHPMVCGPWPPSDTASPPIQSLLTENPKSFGNFLEEVPQLRRRYRRISRDRSLCSSTLPGQGSAPRAISIDSTAIFIVVPISHDEKGVVLPRG
jgi:hypothetical protein